MQLLVLLVLSVAVLLFLMCVRLFITRCCICSKRLGFYTYTAGPYKERQWYHILFWGPMRICSKCLP